MTTGNRWAALLAAGLLAALAARAEESCRAEIGPGRAAILVARCVAVSPATRPPCNADNPCGLIEDEIARGCDLLDADAPDFCAAYRSR